MKRHLSVLCLMARNSIYRAILLIIDMAAVQTVLFFLYHTNAVTAAEAGLPMTALEDLIPRAHIGWVFTAAFLLLTALLCRTGCNFGAQSGYTLDRLSVKPRLVWLWQAVYNTGAYLLFWGAEALLCLGICRLFVWRTDTAFLSEQTVFMALYRCEFLHSLLPLADVSVLIRNGIFAVSLGVVTASFPYLQRRGKLAGELLGMLSFLLFCFQIAPGEPDAAVLESIVVLILAAVSAVRLSGFFEEVEE